MIYEVRFALALLLTLIVEIPLLVIFSRRVFKYKLPLEKLITTGIIASALTLPYLWFVLFPFIPTAYYVFLGEGFVIIIESLIYKQLLDIRLTKAFILSLMLNIASFLVGIVVF